MYYYFALSTFYYFDQKRYFNPKKDFCHFEKNVNLGSKTWKYMGIYLGKKHICGNISPHNFYVFLIFSKILRS